LRPDGIVARRLRAAVYRGAVSVPAIRIEGLTKHFGAVRAVQDLDLEIAAGEVFGYLGPNGAGKTTTIRLLLDFLRPTAGRATVLGRPPVDAALRARIGFLPADLAVDHRYTARDLLDFYGALRGGLDPAWVDTLLQRFDLDPDRRYGELSTGNRRKLGLVQAFAHRPELLLLDEPTSGLDPLLQAEFGRLIREMTARGATVFLSSHVLPEVEELAQRVAILRRGRLVTVAPIAELRAQARARIELRLAAPPPAGAFDAVPGVVEARVEGSTIHLVTEGSMDPVIKRAAALEVVRLVTHEADLEEVFLSFYAGSAGSDAGAPGAAMVGERR
jgi:ABC-2 type transport system ATP-binding protein